MQMFEMHIFHHNQHHFDFLKHLQQQLSAVPRKLR